MKLSNFGRVALALAASLVVAFGTESCTYDYTEAYIIVTGSQYNQVASYKEDNDTGKLNVAPGGVQSSGGTDPVRAVLGPSGRYVYVLNQGAVAADSAGNLSYSSANISVFSIGGEGSLSYQLSYPSQGLGSRRIAISSNGSYLYVLDQYQPGTTSGVVAASTAKSASTPCFDSTYDVYRPAGDITVFSINSATGQLFLVQNLQQQNALGTPLSYFPIGCGAIDFYLGSGFLWTAESSDPTTGYSQVVYTYAESSTTGQLTQVSTPVQQISGASDITVINGAASGGYIYVLDSGNNNIYVFTPGSAGQLSAISTPVTANNSDTSGMTELTTDSSSKYLYITNTNATSLGQSNSAISMFTITPGSGVLVPFANLPTYPTGSGPQCIFEDPSKQFMYTADSASSTVVGAAFDPNTGTLTNLTKGSTFGVIGTPTWCLYSNHTN